MKKTIAFLALALAATPALAMQKYETRQFDCDQLDTVIRHDGAAILRYPSETVKDLTLYGIFARDQLSCPVNAPVATQTVVPVKSGLDCVVKVCGSDSNEGTPSRTAASALDE